MVINIKKYKDIHRISYNIVLKKVKNKESIIEYIDYIYPVIHGLKITKQKNYQFSNIIEAREYLNDKLLSKNILEISKELLKLDNIDFLKKIEKQKLQASLTLFNYITNSKIKSLLVFRNCDSKTIDKFTYNKNYNIFNKLLDKFFNGEKDDTTILLIESELYTFKNKDIILKNLNKKDRIDGEKLLIKYSEINRLVIDNRTIKTTKRREFYKSLSFNEIKIFRKFNISKKYKKIIDKTEKRIITSLSIVILLSSTMSMNALTTNTNTQINPYITITKSVEPIEEEVTTKIKLIKQEEERIRLEKERIAKEEEERKKAEAAKQKKYTNIIKYVEPTGIGNEDMVRIAQGQVGNVGGEPFWRWYGYNYHVEWCAVFVSWVAKEAGIGETIIPKFSAVSVGVKFYKSRGLWRDRNYSPRPGDIIFFDWNNNGTIDHVGIVKNVENGRVYTIEGNSHDVCKEKSYLLTSSYIYGYGTPNY